MDLIGWIVVFVMAIYISVLFYRLNIMHKNEKTIVDLIGLLIAKIELQDLEKKEK